MATSAEAAAATAALDWKEIDLYRFFAAAFGTPTRERFAWLQQPGLKGALEQLWKELGNESPLPALGRYQTYQDYETTYLALFDVGMPEPPIPLVESTHHKSEPAQQVALQCALFYEVLGLRVNPAAYPFDHLVTQLEFLGAVRYAAEKGSGRENCGDLARLERDFLERHLLSWLPAVERKLAREQPPIFWTLCCLLVTFLRHRLRESAALQEEQATS